MRRADFYFRHEGTIILLIPNTKRARVWTKENIQAEPWQMLGRNIAIEHRYFGNILEAITSFDFGVKQI